MLLRRGGEVFWFLGVEGEGDESKIWNGSLELNGRIVWILDWEFLILGWGDSGMVWFVFWV